MQTFNFQSFFIPKKTMFQIDRSYIDHESLESLQGRIWDIRTDHKDDPTLPKIENYGINEKDFEDYLDKKQNFEDFKDNWRRRQLLVYVVIFCIPLVYFSLFRRGEFMQAYITGFLFCVIAFMVYSLIKAARASKFRNNPYETFIKALLSWEEYHNK